MENSNLFFCHSYTVNNVIVLNIMYGALYYSCYHRDFVDVSQTASVIHFCL